MLLEGLSTSIVENIVLTGGGCALPGVFEEFTKSFEEIVELRKPDDPITSNSKGYYMLAKTIAEETEEVTKETKENVTENSEKNKHDP